MNMRWYGSSVLLMLTVQTVMSVPTVQAPWGTIQGVSLEGEEGRKMNSYLAIPYALPPVADLRFEKPRPHPGPDEGKVFVADQVMPACPQAQPGLIGSARKTSEDCLMLDVYVPADDVDTTDSPRSVMIFIHGGGFTMGDAVSYRPSRFVADEKVIVVAVQYRLGALGFLSSGDDTLPGNLALWDQNLAIRWVKDNIRAFGGDPNSITIFGESGGSYSVGLQILSPQSRGLFKRAIMQSGSPLNIKGFLSMNDPKTVFRLITDLFHCQRETNAERLQCLKKVPHENYFSKTQELLLRAPLGGLFFPVVDGEFIPRDVEALVQDEDYVLENGIGDIDVMMGFNNREGSLVLFTLGFAQLPPEALYTAHFFQVIVDFCVKFSQGTPASYEVLEKIVEFFYRGADSGTDKPVSLDTLSDLYGDSSIYAASIEWMRHLSATPHTGARYLYVLDHDFTCNQGGLFPGSQHGDELMLQFDSTELLPPDAFLHAVFNKTNLDKAEQPLALMFVKIGATFAKTGNPSGPVSEAIGDDWPQFMQENEAYLSVSHQPIVVTNGGPYRDRRALWYKLLPQLAHQMSQRSEELAEKPRKGAASEGRREEL